MNNFQERFKQVVFFIVLVVLSVLLFIPLKSIFAAFLGAVTLYILNNNWLNYFIYKKKWNKYMVTALLLTFDFLCLLVPIGILVPILMPKVTHFYNESDQLIEGIKHLATIIEQRIGVTVLSKENLSSISQLVSTLIPDVISSTTSSITNIGIMFFILYYMLINSKQLEYTLSNLIPFRKENTDKISSETSSIVKSYAIGIPILAIAQGIFATLGYWLFGISDPIFFGFLTGIVSIIPFVGTSLVAVPLIVYLFSTSDTANGIYLSIYTVVVIMNIDNVLRLFLLKAFADVHPLITLFGVIVGLKLFGFLGLIFGPLLISYFLLLIKIYIAEYIDN